MDPSPQSGPFKSAALAAMVKTPGLSPVKTRLAARIGTTEAQRVYTYCTECTRGLLQKSAQQGCHVHWAVAEPHAIWNLRWGDYPALLQQGDGLGARMASVSEQLLAHHPYAILIGADSPQLSWDVVEQALQQLDQGCDLVLGPSRDGGFYLIAMRTKLPLEVWEGVVYSRADTLIQFLEHCERLLPELQIDARTLPELGDLDELTDIPHILQELEAQGLSAATAQLAAVLRPLVEKYAL